jgi:hypothetical protein
MKDINRNLMTGIICFTIAIVSLLPLRFVEVSNKMFTLNSYRDEGVVLGEQKEVKRDTAVLLCDKEYLSAFQALLSGDSDMLEEVLILEKTNCIVK